MKLAPETFAALANILTAKLPPEAVADLAASGIDEAALLVALEIVEATRDGDVARFEELYGALRPGPVLDFCAAAAFGAATALLPAGSSKAAPCDT